MGLQLDPTQSQFGSYIMAFHVKKAMPPQAPQPSGAKPVQRVSRAHRPLHEGIFRLSLATDDNPLKVIKTLRGGTPASVVPELARRLGISQDGLFDILGLARSTIKNRISTKGKLAPAEQDRIYRADRVWSRALQVLEDETAARTWITQGNRALGGEAPLALLDTVYGYELVLDTLGRIEYGIVS